MPDPTDPRRDPAPDADGFGGLPIQPTGSGVADLEIAYEQMRLEEGMDGADLLPADPDAVVPTEDGLDAADSAAHPS
jgi:hypothetical protein